METFNNLLRKAFAIAVIFLYNPLAAQYDFDSLYQHDPVFKATFEKVNDTLDLYASDQLINLTIESDFKSLYKNKLGDDYQDAVIRFDLNDTVRISQQIKIKSRGHIRRKVCFYPPLKLNFPKKAVKLKHLQEFDKMKMVVQCKRGSDFEKYLLGEYLTYKLYNILSNYSLRVRLLKVRYVDTNNTKKPMESFAFIIEDIDQLAKRINGVKIETKNIKDPFLFRDQSALVFLFMYMIGNTDWSIPGLHNVKLIKPNNPSSQQVYVIPYDFDYCGIINASYAVPDPKLGIEDVKERLYRGFCRTPEEMQQTVDIFNEKKDDIYELYRQSGLLDKYTLKTTLNYIDDFYQIINSKYAFKHDIVEACR